MLTNWTAKLYPRSRRRATLLARCSWRYTLKSLKDHSVRSISQYLNRKKTESWSERLGSGLSNRLRFVANLQLGHLGLFERWLFMVNMNIILNLDEYVKFRAIFSHFQPFSEADQTRPGGASACLQAARTVLLAEHSRPEGCRMLKFRVQGLIVPFGPLWSPLVPFGPLSSPLVPFGPFGPLWSPLVPFGPLWSPLVPFGPLWSPLVPFGPLWSPLVLKHVNICKHVFCSAYDGSACASDAAVEAEGRRQPHSCFNLISWLVLKRWGRNFVLGN